MDRKRGPPDEVENAAVKRIPEAPEVCFRLLCPVTKVGSIIGKGGAHIKQIREATGARVRVDDNVQGCPERVVWIQSTDSPPGHLCPAQNALQDVMARMMSIDTADGPRLPDEPVAARMLVVKPQVGVIMGPRGVTVKDITQQSGARIRVLQHPDVPPCANFPEDEVIQVSGGYEEVKQAMVMISAKLKEGPAMPLSRPMGYKALGAPPYAGGPGLPPGIGSLPPRDHLDGNGFGPPPHMAAGGGGPTLQENPSLNTVGLSGLVETEFRMLIAENKVGLVIGKGGDFIRYVRTRSNAKVHVEAPVEGCPERVVQCVSEEDANSPTIGAIDAILECLQRLLYEDRANAGQVHKLRFLCPANQIGGVLGKRGATIKQMRDQSGATLVVLPRQEVPKCGRENDEILEITGRKESCITAVRMATLALRGNMVHSQARTIRREDNVGPGMGPGPGRGTSMGPRPVYVPPPGAGPPGMHQPVNPTLADSSYGTSGSMASGAYGGAAGAPLAAQGPQAVSLTNGAPQGGTVQYGVNPLQYNQPGPGGVVQQTSYGQSVPSPQGQALGQRPPSAYGQQLGQSYIQGGGQDVFPPGSQQSLVQTVAPVAQHLAAAYSQQLASKAGGAVQSSYGQSYAQATQGSQQQASQQGGYVQQTHGQMAAPQQAVPVQHAVGGTAMAQAQGYPAAAPTQPQQGYQATGAAPSQPSYVPSSIYQLGTNTAAATYGGVATSGAQYTAAWTPQYSTSGQHVAAGGTPQYASPQYASVMAPATQYTSFQGQQMAPTVKQEPTDVQTGAAGGAMGSVPTSASMTAMGGQQSLPNYPPQQAAGGVQGYAAQAAGAYAQTVANVSNTYGTSQAVGGQGQYGAVANPQVLAAAYNSTSATGVQLSAAGGAGQEGMSATGATASRPTAGYGESNVGVSVSTMRVRITVSQAGLFSGANNIIMSQVQQLSGAQLKLEGPTAGGDFEISMTGTWEQMTKAQAYLQQALSTYHH